MVEVATKPKLSDVINRYFSHLKEIQIQPDRGHPDVEVDCAARVHICKTVCCRFKLALTREEVERGLKFDIDNPYIMRKGSDGYCYETKDGGCGIYESRPVACRTYSCAKDKRVWEDFDRMIPGKRVREMSFQV